MKILVIEDDPMTGSYIVQGLREEGHSVDLIEDGSAGLIQATVGAYDLMVVDRLLPGLDGVSIVKTLRGAKNRVPVLFLTALGGVDDRIEGLNSGADDYLVKPFAFGELSARVAALGRRPQLNDAPTLLRIRDMEMNLLTRKVTRAGRDIDLLPREFALLEQLIKRKGRVMTRTMLLEAVWDIHFDPQTNVVETHISRLRAKIDKPFEGDLIQTVRGSGYRIAAE
ncbi:response regulator transcription factor [Roseovarius nanhaiticus]|uniref:winged helix-turn-helix domain-containing protein n=1 Tax=Roseovarius nanhaiticus TaxID=573024 RepID=UPI002490BC92|nr:response regulator transcription factor [Roseovarius nanhaiticus]